MRLTDALRLIVGTFDCCGMGWKTWRRPTLPCLETQYHGRWGFSRPSSGWDRVRAPREDHQVVQPIRSRQFSVASWQTESQTGWGWGFWCCCVCRATEDDFHAWCASFPVVPCFLTTDDRRLTTVLELYRAIRTG